MRKVSKMHLGKKMMMCVSAIVLALTLGLCIEQFSVISHAQSQGKVTAKSANIRKEPSSSSTVVGSAFKDASVTINHQITASDGKVWYQVFVDADTLGYIRSDLVQITDGTTPPVKGQESVATPTPSAQETPATVEAVTPVSATVKGSQKVRVRSNASTTSQIVTAVQNGMAITVTGKANGADGKVWYQVQFINNGTDVKGFIRSDYVTLSGELTAPEVDSPVVVDPPAEPQQPSQPVDTVKEYETSYDNEKWYLIHHSEGVRYVIDDMFNAANQNQQLYTDWEKEHKKVKSQKATIILMVIIMIAMAAVIAFLVYKIKDMMDSAYINAVERDTMRRRNETKGQSGNQKVMHTVGAEKQTNARPTGAKPAQGSRPAGSGRPSGAAQPQPARPSGAAQPQPARPSGAAQAQTARSSGAAQAQTARPSGTTQPQTARPKGTTQPQTVRPTTNVQSTQSGPVSEKPDKMTQPGQSRPAAEKAATPVQKEKPEENTAKPGWQSKNFMQDDDEFEFEFLHWDGEDDN